MIRSSLNIFRAVEGQRGFLSHSEDGLVQIGEEEWRIVRGQNMLCGRGRYVEVLIAGAITLCRGESRDSADAMCVGRKAIPVFVFSEHVKCITMVIYRYVTERAIQFVF